MFIINFFWNYQIDFDENLENKRRFPWLLTCKYKINQKVQKETREFPAIISRIIFNSSKNDSSVIQYRMEFFDNNNNYIERNDVIEIVGTQYSLNGKLVNAIIHSDDISWDDFEFIPNK